MAFGSSSIGGPMLVFAHRGGSRLAPENTLAAFDRAVSEGVDGLELDVRLSADGEVVVCHDPTLDRTCDVTGPIARHSAGDLARADAGFRFSPGDGTHPFRGCGLGVPTLREVLERYPRQWLIVELKEESDALARAVVGLVQEAGAVTRVCLGSFYDSALRRARRLAPDIATSGGRAEVFRALVTSRLGFFPPFTAFDALQVPERRENVQVVSPKFVRAAHRAGVPVQVWIVDRAEDVRRLASWGVDAVITDRPDVAVRTVAEVRSLGAPSAG